MQLRQPKNVVKVNQVFLQWYIGYKGRTGDCYRNFLEMCAHHPLPGYTTYLRLSCQNTYFSNLVARMTPQIQWPHEYFYPVQMQLLWNLAMAALLAMFQTHLCMFSLPCCMNSGEIAHMSGTTTGVPRAAPEGICMGSWLRNRDPVQIPVCTVWCEEGLQQHLATSPRCTEVMETTQNWRLNSTLFCCIIYASNFAMLNNTPFILIH